MMATRGCATVAFLLAACTANPPAPDAAPTPEPTPPAVAETPPALPETPPPPVPEPAPPPVPQAEPATLTLHAVLLTEGATIVVEALPSGHVLFRDDYHFAVYPAGGSAATELHALPANTLAPPFELEDEEDDEDEPRTTLEALHGAWPDQLYATTEFMDNRGGVERLSWRWDGDEWKEFATPGEGPYKLSTTYERFFPWTKGRYLVERGLSCTEGCPSEEEMFKDDDEGMSAADRKILREIDRKLERFKPFAVVGGKATALPELPGDGLTHQMVTAATGDLWLPRRGGAVDRWNVTTKAWQAYAPPPGDGAKLAVTSKGAAYYAICNPAHLYHLSEGTATPIALPGPGCVDELTVDREDRLWLVLRPDAPGPAPNQLWRRQGELWQRVDVRLTLPGGPKRWSYDGLAWTEVEVPQGEFSLRPDGVMAFGPGEVWVHGTIEGGMFVLAREAGGLPPFDLRVVPPPFADVEDCVVQYVRLGTLPAGEDPARAWAAAFKYLAGLPADPPTEIDDPEPHVYEVAEAGERAFYVMFGETSAAGGKAIQARLAALIPGAPELKCGVSPQPTREHALPEPGDDADEDPPEAPEVASPGPAVPKDLKAAMEAKRPTDAAPAGGASN